MSLCGQKQSSRTCSLECRRWGLYDLSVASLPSAWVIKRAESASSSSTSCLRRRQWASSVASLGSGARNEPGRLTMTLRNVVLAALLVVLVVAGSAVPAGAKAPTTLTINANPNPILAGEEVLIYGYLKGPDNADQKVVLHGQSLAGGTFAVKGRMVTNAEGFYSFVRADGIVTTSENWFVTSPPPEGARSRTVHERVAALLSMAASATVGRTNGGPLEFSGQVGPGAVHAGEAVLLQEQSGLSGGAWSTIGRGVIGTSGSYEITHTFRQPGDFNLRAWFRGDKRNSQTWSDPVTIAINQAENPTFTIFVSAPTVVFGGSVSVSGTVYAPGSSTVPLPATKVTLWGHPAAASYAPLTSTVTGPDGSYSFAQVPSTNEVYQVRTTVVLPAQRKTSQVFEGVVDVVTLHASSTSPLVGETVTFTGAVSPDSTGHVISLEQLGTDANFHVVETGHVGPGSAYAFTWTLSAPGPVAFRALVGGGRSNVSAASPTVTVAASLPTVTTTSRPTGTTTTTTTTATVVTVTANTPTTFSFTLATAGQAPVASDSAVKLTVPAGKVTFNVNNPESSILSHDFKVCSAPVTAAEAKKAVVALPSTCAGTSTPVLAPGSAMTTLTLDLMTPGSYEYLSSVSGDALSGMKGILAVT